MRNEKPIIIYHGNCYDGVTAAWACFKRFGSDAEYLPTNYSDSPPNVKGRAVIIADFSFKRPVMEQIIEDAYSLIVLDHHKTAEAELAGLKAPHIKIIFDMNRSGAGITWDYFFGSGSRPILVNYIEDRDLWRFKLPKSKEVNAFYQSFDINLETWIDKVGPRAGDITVAEERTSLLRLEGKYTRQICANAELKEIDGFVGPYVQTSILMSEVCHELLQQYPNHQFSWYSFKRKDGKTQYGLRGRGEFDVSVIAKNHGGGGHKSAAGFESDVEL